VQILAPFSGVVAVLAARELLRRTCVVDHRYRKRKFAAEVVSTSTKVPNRINTFSKWSFMWWNGRSPDNKVRHKTVSCPSVGQERNTEEQVIAEMGRQMFQNAFVAIIRANYCTT
jgi:hypothetical protein